MRHANAFKKLSLTTPHRRALLRNMATSLLRLERFETTYRRAKSLQPVVEKLIRLGAQDNLPARRKAYGFLFDKAVVHKLFSDLGPRYRARNGGYTRVVRTAYRHGDAAQLAVIELVRDGSEKQAAAASVKAATVAKSAKPAKKEAKPKAAAKSKSDKGSKEKTKKSSKKSE